LLNLTVRHQATDALELKRLIWTHCMCVWYSCKRFHE
jgi:hypothetical protein